jgi:two-component system, cell cycle response regulator
MVKDLGNGIYLITKTNIDNSLHCNTYLIVEDNQAVLVEPGSSSDFDFIFSEIQTVIDPLIIKYILLSHPDVDLSGSITMFEDMLNPIKIITEWRSKEIIEFYGTKSKYYLIKNNNYTLKLSDERTLYFMPAAFMHAPGAFVTYDSKAKVLFSGDIFGGYSRNWQVEADDSYIESMAMWHENYIPSSDFLRPLMKELAKMNLRMILPQHGSIIKGDFVEKSINFLYELDFYNSSFIINNLTKDIKNYNYENILIQIIIRLISLYSQKDVKDVFGNSEIEISFNPISVQSKLTDTKLWNTFFDIIYQKMGDQWLNSIESIVNKISRTYDLKTPHVYNSKLRELQEKQMEIYQENLTLKQKLNSIFNQYETIQEKEKKCPITGLYNKEIFNNYLQENYDSLKESSSVFFIEIDQIEQINNRYSNKIGDDTIRMVSYLIMNNKLDNELLFRGYGAGFLFIIKDKNKSDVLTRALELRNIISDSPGFIEEISISIAIVYFDEFTSEDKSLAIKEFIHQGQIRIEYASKKKNGEIVDNKMNNIDLYHDLVLLVDEDEININMLTKYLEDEDIKLLHARNPLEAIEIIKTTKISIIISEINLAKLDGFALKQYLNKTADFSTIPFIFISHLKTHDTIERANDLNVDYFLKKPYFPNEIVGIIKRLLKR